MSLALQIEELVSVFCHEVLSDLTCGQDLVVITFELVLGIFAVDLLLLLAQDHRSKVCVSSSHLAQKMG